MPVLLGPDLLEPDFPVTDWPKREPLAAQREWVQEVQQARWAPRLPGWLPNWS